jgi:hypothetical protein
LVFIYRNFVSPLAAAGYRVIVPDHLGFGCISCTPRAGPAAAVSGGTTTSALKVGNRSPAPRAGWKIASMPGTDMVPALITGGAVVVGVLVGGTVTAVTTWTTIRRSRKDTRDDRRRAAYAAFIGAQEELRRVLDAWETADPLPTADEFAPAIAQTVNSVDRAFVAVTLAGPPKAQGRADEVRGKAWGVYNAIYRPEGLGQPVLPKLGERVSDYIDACDRFTQTASEVLRAR